VPYLRERVSRICVHQEGVAGRGVAMNEREEIFLKLQTGKTAVICELADRLLQAGLLSTRQLDELVRKVIQN
jgi:hypothetical protein